MRILLDEMNPYDSEHIVRLAKTLWDDMADKLARNNPMSLFSHYDELSVEERTALVDSIVDVVTTPLCNIKRDSMEKVEKAELALDKAEEKISELHRELSRVQVQTSGDVPCYACGRRPVASHGDICMMCLHDNEDKGE